MLQQAQDFLADVEVLAGLLETLSPDDWNRTTTFKSWTFNDFSEDDFVEGSAVDFCHVVTQVRNIADVDLTVWGDVSEAWMSIAQCFAGPPEDPPAAGSRLVR